MSDDRIEVSGPVITEELRREMLAEFDKADSDKSGKLSKKEFLGYMAAMGRKEQGKYLFRAVDVNGDKEIDRAEFSDFLGSLIELCAKRDGRRYLTLIFKACDKGKLMSKGKPKGYLTKKEFVLFCKMVGATACAENPKLAYKNYDENGDGKVTLEEILSRFNAVMQSPTGDAIMKQSGLA